MKTIAYQQKAIQELTAELTAALGRSGFNQKIVFKAPTGSGKTYMTLETLRRLAETLPNDYDSPYKEVAFVWIDPNSLHEQSYDRMRKSFNDDFALHPLKFGDIDRLEGKLRPFDILCLNWQSVNSDDNIFVRDNEHDFNFYTVCERTRESDIPIIVIIDEEHLFTGKNATQSLKVLGRMHPKIELRVSATPITANATKTISIVREDVVAEEMIKRKIQLNPQLSQGVDANRSLLHKALQKREELLQAYKNIGSNVNPLLLIQLPNDNKMSMDEDEKALRYDIEKWLSEQDITTDNGRLAIWLANEDVNREGISEPNNMTQVLLFKQAIALGWDCPRAAVLLIYRELKSQTFTTQTVGRIMRMPEQCHYTDDRLNDGYVYTDLSADMIQIVADEITMSTYTTAKRREDLNNISLPSFYAERKADTRNRLRPSIKKYLFQAFEEKLGVKQIHLKEFDFDETFTNAKQNRKIVELKGLTTNVQELSVLVVKDVELMDEHTANETGVTYVNSKVEFNLTITQIMNNLNHFCKRMLGGEFESISFITLRVYLLEVVCDLFGYEPKTNEHAARFCLFRDNQGHIAEVVAHAISLHRQANPYTPGGRQTKQADKNWEVPPCRMYENDKYDIHAEFTKSALTPCLLAKDASNPEKEFILYLEQHRDKIDWWYKNGDSGRENFAVPYPYKSEGKQSLFYVDFVIRMTDGSVYLFDTKTQGSDPKAAEKHNALLEYMQEQSDKLGIKLRGGIIIYDQNQWKYSRFRIQNTINLNSWEAFV